MSLTFQSPTQQQTREQEPTDTPFPTYTQPPTPKENTTPTPPQTQTPPPTQSLPSSVGTRSNPASKATSLTTEFDWIGGNYTAKITLLETIRGHEAWRRVYEANMFNDEPDQGFEYILVKIRFEYLSGPTDTKYDVSPVFFDVVSQDGLVYDYKSNVPPDPSLSTSLYQGASHEGWACFQVAQGDAHPLLSFGTDYAGRGGIWFKLY